MTAPAQEWSDLFGKSPKKKRRFSSVQHALAALRKSGWTCAIVEKWNPHVGIRQDLFGMIDIVAIRPDNIGVLGVQTAGGAWGHIQEHVNKITEKPALKIWLEAGNRLEIFSFTKVAPRDKRPHWQLRRVPIVLDFQTGEPTAVL